MAWWARVPKGWFGAWTGWLVLGVLNNIACTRAQLLWLRGWDVMWIGPFRTGTFHSDAWYPTMGGMPGDAQLEPAAFHAVVWFLVAPFTTPLVVYTVFYFLWFSWAPRAFAGARDGWFVGATLAWMPLSFLVRELLILLKG